MTTIRVRFQSTNDDRCMLVGAESLDPYLAQTLAEDLRRNSGDRSVLDIDVPHGETPRALGVLVAALERNGLRVRMTTT